MFEKNELALLNQSDGADVVAELIKKGTGGFLPRLKCAQGIGKAVTEGTAKVGDLMLGEQNLGREIKVVVGPFRSHALQIEQKTFKLEEESFDVDDKLFQDIQRRQKIWIKGAQAGPEYLCWAPDLGEFILVHFVRGALPFADKMQLQQGKMITLRSQLVGKKTRWPVFEVLPIDQTTYTPAEEEDYEEAVKQFTAPQRETKGEPAGRPR